MHTRTLKHSDARVSTVYAKPASGCSNSKQHVCPCWRALLCGCCQARGRRVRPASSFVIRTSSFISVLLMLMVKPCVGFGGLLGLRSLGATHLFLSLLLGFFARTPDYTTLATTRTRATGEEPEDENEAHRRTCGWQQLQQEKSLSLVTALLFSPPPPREPAATTIHCNSGMH